MLLPVFQPEDVPVWWEMWLRQAGHERFIHAAASFGIRVQPTERLTFPEREVILANATVTAMGTLMAGTDAIAELRIASDTPATFLGFRNFEQADWARDLAERVRLPSPDAPVVCILDSGITHMHRLLAAAIPPRDVHTYDRPGERVTARLGKVMEPRWRASLFTETSSRNC